MAINPLSLAESLRPWRVAGIVGLLVESRGEGLVVSDDWEGGDREGDAEFPREARAAGVARPEASRASGRGNGALVPERTPAAAPPAVLAGRPVRPGGGAFCSDAHGEKDERKESGRAGKQRSRTAASLNWPEAWRALLARTRPAPIVWTYAELGEDLAGNGDKERAACLRRMIASLRLPKGSSAFWPICLAPCAGKNSFPEPRGNMPSPLLPADAAFREEVAPRTDEAEFFQAGLERLAPKVVIMLGRPAVGLSGLNLTLSVPFTQQILQGTQYVLLPDFSSVLAATAAQERTSAFLRAVLSGVALF